MDYREQWMIDDDSLMNDVNNFGVSIAMQVAEHSTPDNSPIHIEAGDIFYILAVYDKKTRKRTGCIFSSLDDATFFINNYLTTCHNILDVNGRYGSFLASEDVICNKGYVS